MEEENKNINQGTGDSVQGTVSNRQEPGASSQKPEATLQKLLKNKVFLLAGAIVIFLVIVGIVTLITGKGGKNGLFSGPTPTVNLTSPEATVYFSPTTINAPSGKVQTVDVYVNTWSKEISGANISVAYNPNVVGTVTLTQFKDKNSTVSYAFELASSQNDTVNGLISLPLQMAATTPLQKGLGKVAVLTFIPKSTNITKTSISFSPATALISREGGKTIVLQKSTLIVNYPVNGVFPTEQPPIIYK